jgi:hypothetical protein
MNPTRRTQPYRKGAREQTSALSAMLAGRPMYLPNPQDVQRKRLKQLSLLLKKSRA